MRGLVLEDLHILHPDPFKLQAKEYLQWYFICSTGCPLSDYYKFGIYKMRGEPIPLRRFMAVSSRRVPPQGPPNPPAASAAPGTTTHSRHICPQATRTRC